VVEGLTGMETAEEHDERRLRRVRTELLHDRVLWRAAAAGVVWLAGYAAATFLTQGSATGRQVVGDVVYLAPVALAAIASVVVARRASGRRRRLWHILAASNLLWLGGDLVWAGYAFLLREDAPFPSVADLLYLSSYLLVPLAVLVGFAGASGRRRARAVLDSAVVVLGLGIAGWQVLIAPQLSGGMSWATATGIAYPALGIVIVVTLVCVGFAGHRHVAPSLWLVAAAFTVSAVTDASYTYLSSLNDYVTGDWLNLGWQAEAVLLALAGLTALRHDEGDATVLPLGKDLAMVPVLVGVTSVLGLVAVEGRRHGVDEWVLAAAAVVVFSLVVRFVLSVGDTRRAAQRLDASLQEQQRLAITDGLTGLYNRRFCEEILGIEVDRTRRSAGPLALLVADLDRFKQVNDRYGHQSGDAVLVEAAARLRRTLRTTDVMARYGGEEFVVVLPDTDGETALELAERCRLALSQEQIRLYDGSWITVTASFGLATTDTEPASDVSAAELIRNADRALYAAKRGGRDRVVIAHGWTGGPTEGADLPDALLPLAQLADMVDARVGSHEHSAAMSRWAGVLADALGLDPAARCLVVQAARLHDIGKIVISEAVLGKAGPLDEEEWRLIRSHPAAGERLIRDVPGHEALAAVVRGQHERIDGRGYPDGLRGDQLPIETRIVSVLDTWAAMVAHRAYRPALTVDEARAELLAARGTQLDADVVDAFLALQAADLIGHLARTAAAEQADGQPTRSSVN
jgi:two-component system cell cycle response regulator